MKNIIFDLDGTILEDDKSLSSETAESIRNISKNNIITIATGRSLVGMPKSLSYILDCIDYFITSNGTTIYNSRNELIYKDRISFAFAQYIIKDFLDVPNSIVEILADGRWHINKKDAKKFNVLGLEHSVLEYILKTRIQHDDLVKYIIDNKLEIEKISLNICGASYTDDVYHCIDSIAKQYSLRYCSDNPHKVDIFKSSTTKGEAIKYLREYCKVDREDTISFGNDENDIEMFQESGVAICMSTSSTKVKSFANIVLKKNDKKRIQRALSYLKKDKII